MSFSRHIALFLLPSVFAVLIAVLLPPPPGSAERMDAMIAAVLANDDAGVEHLLTEMVGEVKASVAEGFADPSRLQWMQRMNTLAGFSILVGFGLLALFIPPCASAQSKGNALTTLALGYCAAQLVVRFRYFDWPNFLTWAAPGFCAAFAIVLLRGYFAARRENICGE